MACSGDEDTRLLRVDLRTDYGPIVEFEGVRFQIGDGDLAFQQDRIVSRGEDYLRGQRLGEDRVAPGIHPITVMLFGAGARVITERRVMVDVREDVTVVTVVITRDCEDVVCPNDNPALIGCLGGRCADPRCSPETPEFCPPAECASDDECTSDVACVASVCSDGVCLDAPDDAVCSPQVCHGVRGCVSVVSNDRDGGVTDASVMDVGTDAAMDASDAAADANDAGMAPAVVCDDWSPGVAFDAPSPLSFTGFSDSIGEMKLSPDGARLYFGSNETLWVAERLDETTFGMPVAVPGIDDTTIYGAGFRRDELEAVVMVVTMDISDLWLYRRSSTSMPFARHRSLSELNTPRSDWDGFLSWDGLRLYGAQVRADSITEIFRMERATWSEPFSNRVTPLPAGAIRANPSLTYDENVVVFNQVESGESTIYYATSDGDGGFTAGEPLPGIGVGSEPYLSPDGCELFFTNDGTTYLARHVRR